MLVGFLGLGLGERLVLGKVCTGEEVLGRGWDGGEAVFVGWVGHFLLLRLLGFDWAQYVWEEGCRD